MPEQKVMFAGDEVRRVLDELEEYVGWIFGLATASHAAGLTALEAAQAAVPADHPEPVAEMVALHGGPIVSHP